jgi:hypothetical protein
MGHDLQQLWHPGLDCGVCAGLGDGMVVLLAPGNPAAARLLRVKA